MRSFTVIASLAAFIMFVSCMGASDSLMEPGTESSLGHSDTRLNDASICHNNMESINNGIFMFYGLNNRFPDSLAELASIDPELVSLTCPSCSLGYEYKNDGSGGFLLECPLPEEPDHGFVEDGWISWPADSSTWLHTCQTYMLALRSACSMYYGIYNEYPSELQDLVNEGLIPFIPECPECNAPYQYFSDSTGSYSIYCPLPSDPTHGYIIDGITYFPRDTTNSQEICRNNMRCLATATAMYYGAYNRYPEELRLLGTTGIMENWWITCPACGRKYDYWTDEEGQVYAIYCPLPRDPNHGSVYDGVVSWL